MGEAIRNITGEMWVPCQLALGMALGIYTSAGRGLTSAWEKGWMLV